MRNERDDDRHAGNAFPKKPRTLRDGLRPRTSHPQTKGDAQLLHALELGAGRFHVDWTMSDSGGRVCSARWEWGAKLGRKQRDFPLTLEPDTVAEQTEEEVGAAKSVAGQGTREPFAVKPWHSILEPHDSAVLFSSLRGLADQPGVTYSGLLAFNLRE
jgi:hypothetical protein